MKKLTSLAMAFALTGVAGSAFAGTSTDNGNATALHASTTFHFNGLVEEPTCSFKGKSMKVALPPVSADAFADLKEGEVAANSQKKDFDLHIACASQFESSRVHMKITGQGENNILENTHGTAKGMGLEIFSGDGNSVLPIGQELNSTTAGLTNAFLNSDNTLHLSTNYVRTSGEVTAGKLATDAVFEIYYK
ncbi:fimbrial protein [Enterobacter cloacae]|uniref:fimbrial protein n=1 Tax=Enterobacter cloacae TaxID=550 RepID=UPI0021838BD9|nr:fimbrial protein [Enterobacter cloacae]MCT2764269.1 type 1 fimbrial protein [Enterobacter cloacae]